MYPRRTRGACHPKRAPKTLSILDSASLLRTCRVLRNRNVLDFHPRARIKYRKRPHFASSTSYQFGFFREGEYFCQCPGHLLSNAAHHQTVETVRFCSSAILLSSAMNHVFRGCRDEPGYEGESDGAGVEKVRNPVGLVARVPAHRN